MPVGSVGDHAERNAVAGLKRQGVHALRYPHPGPLFDAASESAARASTARDAFAPRAVDQGRHDLPEHDAVRGPRAAASQRMARRELLLRRQEGGELLPQGVWQAGRPRRRGPSVSSRSVESFMITNDVPVPCPKPRADAQPHRVPVGSNKPSTGHATRPSTLLLRAQHLSKLSATTTR